ncbi:hypothetical protein K2Z83_28110 [Oscillochloris sp. ZM17-4]|uniref:proton-conducting transporter transmembrane domain-containing protein n=1 Tax=Oscillochloris sp. ZM17-4 TaxID=2866714 RepID=UPI001C739DC7|nr:proton-conducting transporter membrane subunit [Oscillochloris sp. ZM17-4]MBX0331521.1 hypothetical protein [Oscillochloris sp. ZM17-4]
MPQDGAGRIERGLLIILIGMAALSAAMLAAQAIAAQPARLPGLTIDRLSAAISLLVAGVGAVAYRFALRYLDGEPGQRAFLRWLCATVLAAYLLIFATSLPLLFGAWLLTSVGLHQLLTYYHGRAEAHPPARKKFLISRLGDLALLAAIGLIGWQWGTLDLTRFLARLDEPTSWPIAAQAVALLLVTAALTKSAQFPFHSWLPETMEAPTPVSALMHAGVINAGGVLLLHFAPLLARAPAALLLLTAVGTVTAGLGMLAMWAQPHVKQALAWSTVSQMGFMMVQLGLAAWPAAALHLLGHGCYKAWAFLRSGDLPRPAAAAITLAPARALAIMLLGVAAALPALALAAQITGFDPLHAPGDLALAGVVALGIGQLWLACFQTMRAGRAAPAALGLSLAGATLALALYRGAAIFLAPVLGDLPAPAGPLAWAAAALPLAGFAGLSVLHTLLPALGRSAAGRALFAHALHGFYVGALADRAVGRVWGRTS